jgi:quercetin dioxygenase-like cupin family protein
VTGTPDEPRGMVVGPGEGEDSRSPIGGDMTFLARGEQTNGALVAADVAVPPGQGPPLHVHTREDEWAYVLEGDLRWKLGDELSATPAGSFVFIPRGVAHTFQNTGSEPGRMLVMFAPAGMETFFDRLSKLTAFDPDAFRRAGAEVGMDTVGPPLAESNPL